MLNFNINENEVKNLQVSIEQFICPCLVENLIPS